MKFRKILEEQAKLEQVSMVTESTQTPKKPSTKKESVTKLSDITSLIRDNMIKIKKENPIKDGIEVFFYSNKDRDKANKLVSNRTEEEDKKLTFYLV